MKYILLFFISTFLITIAQAQTWEELDSLTTYYLENEELDSAEKYLFKAFELAKNKYGVNSKNYAKSLGDVASYNYLKYFTIKESTELLDSAKRILENLNDTICNEYMLVLNHLNYIYDDCYDYDKAEWCAKKCVEITGILEGEASENYAINLHNLAWVYLHKSNFSMASKLFEKSYIIFRDSLRKETESYAFLLNSLATYYTKRGFDNFAEDFLKKSLEIRKKLYGEKSRWYAIQLGNIGEYFFNMGRYEAAEPLLTKSSEIIFDLFKDTNMLSAYAYMDLAKIQWHKGNYLQAEELLKKGIHIFEKLKITDYPEYYTDFKALLSTLYNNKKEYKKSISILEDVLEKCKLFFGDNSVYTAEMSGKLANAYYLNGDYKKSEKYFQNSISKFNDILGGTSSEYGNLLASLAEVYVRLGRTEEAEKLYLKANNFYFERINKFYNGLSEKEKLEFNRTVNPHIDKFFSFAVKRYDKNPKISSDIINFSIATKGLILNSITTMKNAILNSKDTNLMEKYERLLYLRQSLANAYTLSKEDIHKKGINIKALEEEANEIEKDIASSKVIDFRIAEEKWTDIQKKMKNNECFIEFISFRIFDKDFLDSVIYFAGIIKKNLEYPILTKLCDQKDLISILNMKADNIDGYQKNKETSNNLYNLIFKPIEPFLDSIKTIYLSPAGLLNRVSFAALNIDRENYLCEKYDLRYLTNLKDYINEENYYENHQKYTNALFGGINYDIDSSGTIKIIPEKSRGENDDEWSPPGDMIIQNASLKVISKWNFLQGTEDEIERINFILQKNKLEVVKFSGNEATEESIKSLCKRNSPDIIHIATHGFFFNEPRETQESSAQNPFKKSSNPLFRSGLIFAGANWVWSGGREIEGIENGILTAYEVSNMDLQNTELVVLSACETGLGDIKGGEGVYGLQRAFKVAGAKTIIMSLWKVPDKETVELMELFYSNWIEKKMTKHEAFSQAQREMRKKYLPYYWAAFVMVE